MSHACVNGVVDILVAMFVHCSLLERCRTRLSVTCPWLRSSTMELYVKCQLCEPCPDKCRDVTNICILHKEKGCSHFDCGHYIPLGSSGLSCEHSVDAVPDYPREKLDPWVQVRKKTQCHCSDVEGIRRVTHHKWYLYVIVGFDAEKFEALICKRFHVKPKFSVSRIARRQHEYMLCFVVDIEVLQ